MWSAYQDVSDIMDLELVPFGKASFEVKPGGGVSFECQHGPNECTGNMVQACALNIYPADKQVPFVKCMMSKRSPYTAGETCAKSLGLEYDKVDSCVKGSDGQKYLLEMGRKKEALDPKLNFVPWILVNGKRDSAALGDLKSSVCAAYTGPKPAKCP